MCSNNIPKICSIKLYVCITKRICISFGTLSDKTKRNIYIWKRMNLRARNRNVRYWSDRRLTVNKKRCSTSAAVEFIFVSTLSPFEKSNRVLTNSVLTSSAVVGLHADTEDNSILSLTPTRYTIGVGFSTTTRVPPLSPVGTRLDITTITHIVAPTVVRHARYT